MSSLLQGCLGALIRKEVHQILHDRQLIFLLIVPPILQLMIYGFALNPDVQHLRLGIVDQARTFESRHHLRSGPAEIAAGRTPDRGGAAAQTSMAPAVPVSRLSWSPSW